MPSAKAKSLHAMPEEPGVNTTVMTTSLPILYPTIFPEVCPNPGSKSKPDNVSTFAAVISTAPVCPFTLVTGYGGGLLAEYCFTLSTFPSPTSLFASVTGPVFPATLVTGYG